MLNTKPIALQTYHFSGRKVKDDTKQRAQCCSSTRGVRELSREVVLYLLGKVGTCAWVIYCTLIRASGIAVYLHSARISLGLWGTWPARFNWRVLFDKQSFLSNLMSFAVGKFLAILIVWHSHVAIYSILRTFIISI
ncbi:hypothetical protein V1504DRAFT_446210, partial [Lipomyces starkeyi]